MRLFGYVMAVVLALMLIIGSSGLAEAGCRSKCKKAGSTSGKRYTSRATGIKYCLCSHPTKFLKRAIQ